MSGSAPAPPSGNPLTRRKFLAVSGVAAGALAVGSALVMRGGGSDWYRSLLRPGAEPKSLSLKALGVLHALCDAVVGELPEGQPSARDARLAERIDRELSFHFPRMTSDLEAALMLIEHGGLRRLDFTRFTRLSPEARHLALEKLAAGSALEKEAFFALRLMVLFYFYCDERTWKAIHYDGPLMKVRKPPEADSNPFAGGAPHG